MTAVIEVNGLTKRYGDHAVVDDISFHVDRGEIFGILGLIGAPMTKTTVNSVGGCCG
jgi:ABC-2 type transport system ATP-binding protein